MLTIGTDPYQFEFQDVFLQLPANLKLGYTHGVCVDTADNVYVFNQSQTAVLLFNRHGEYQRSWGEEFQHGAHGMRLTDEDHAQFLYLTDYENHAVTKTSLRGLQQFRLGVPPRPDLYHGPSDFKPTDACVAPDGTIFVFDGYGKQYVHAYNRKGKYLFTHRRPRHGRRQVQLPPRRVGRHPPARARAVRGRPRQRPHPGVQPGRQVPPGHQAPGAAAAVRVLPVRVRPVRAGPAGQAGRAGRRRTRWRPCWATTPRPPAGRAGRTRPTSSSAGKFSSPHAVAIDTHGDVYVAEWISTGRVTKLIRKSPPPDTMRPQIGRMT